jgi:hypothetical protein
MNDKRLSAWSFLAAAIVFVALVGWPAPSRAQTVSGQARAVQATVSGLFGMTAAVLTDTGTLSDSGSARQASQLTGNALSLVSAETLHATTIGWPDQVDSEASLAQLAVTAGGSTIGADFVMARASAIRGAAGVATASIDGLAINGVPIAVTDSPNQRVVIPGGVLVINEQQISGAGTVVNALHVIIYGIADVVIASASAGVQ